MVRILLVILMGLCGRGDSPDGDAAKKDLELMQGDWAAASMVRDGVSFPDEEAQAYFRTVKGDHYTVFYFRKVLGKGTFRLDATKQPKTIDFVPDAPMGAGKPMRGVYEISAKTYRICVAPPGKDRPTEFSAKEGSGHTLTVWEREGK